uniref:Chaperone DnaJ n=1 Tax=Rhodosorus marinus TaxID=101924 RepID=A0A7S2ZH44_9RHOD|mmetsp:Transcript_16873/g.68918  ORF Transcript_16873/g.68918 Transcript_16873/m.68918 type:complete len:438 (+) Transcript_16873:578-1891(+)
MNLGGGWGLTRLRGRLFRSLPGYGPRRSLANQAQRKKDYYEILGVGKNAGHSDIKRAFYRLAKELHPDSGGDKEKFAEVNTAYQTLGDEKKRRIYDQFGQEGVQAADMGADPTQNPFSGGGGFGGFGNAGAGAGGGFNTTTAEEFLRDVSDFFGGGNAHRAPSPESKIRGEDLQTTVTLQFLESIKGMERTITVPALVECSRCDGSGKTGDTSITNCRNCRGTGMETMARGFFIQQSTCSRCGGSGRIVKNPCGTCDGNGQVRGKRSVTVVVPPGVDSGDSLRVPAKGNAGVRGGSAGSLYVKIRVEEDSFFHRDGLDLHVVAPITFSQAVLGGTVDVRTIDGTTPVKIAAGTQQDDQTILNGYGVPGVGARGPRGKGNQVVHFKIVIPTRASKEELELVRKLAEVEKVKVTPVCPTLLKRFGNFLRNITGKQRAAR